MCHCLTFWINFTPVKSHGPKQTHISLSTLHLLGQLFRVFSLWRYGGAEGLDKKQAADRFSQNYPVLPVAVGAGGTHSLVFFLPFRYVSLVSTACCQERIPSFFNSATSTASCHCSCLQERARCFSDCEVRNITLPVKSEDCRWKIAYYKNCIQSWHLSSRDEKIFAMFASKYASEQWMNRDIGGLPPYTITL